MEYLRSFFVTNIILLVISAIMLFIAIYNIRLHKKISICLILISSLVLFISVIESLELYFKSIAAISLTTMTSFLKYVLRPLCVILFIILSNGEPKGKWQILFYTPFVINLGIYLLSFIPATRNLVFYFIGEEGESIAFQAGPLRFSSHIVSGLYLIYFIYVSFMSLRLKHISNGVIILVGVSLIVSCVVLETFFDNDGRLNLLNTGIMVSVMAYYLFLFFERMRHDALTGLFNRSTYYQDSARMENNVAAIVQFDMNGLKYLNDNFGHEEGDNAIKTVGDIIAHRCGLGMYAYRLGGDEFTVIIINASEEKTNDLVNRIVEDLSKTKYSCSVGLAYRNDKKITFDELVKNAEKDMYKAKAEYYKTSKIERRQ